MEGRLDPQTGDYSIEVVKDPEDFADREFEVKNSHQSGNPGSSGGVGSNGQNNFFEQRNFMYCRYLHHPGLSAI